MLEFLVILAGIIYAIVIMRMLGGFKSSNSIIEPLPLSTPEGRRQRGLALSALLVLLGSVIFASIQEDDALILKTLIGSILLSAPFYYLFYLRNKK